MLNNSDKTYIEEINEEKTFIQSNFLKIKKWYNGDNELLKKYYYYKKIWRISQFLARYKTMEILERNIKIILNK